ncbi:rab3 GTPase-activating protein non-catalytic subunit-like isoform X4 [Phoenix dactylifera]|uniref:Rab3 GTPase-activating protein non-catalytic subunit-like isoform X4 n=1 Tax=Phoenix dactylifera TaxID=42345 RepID=A0A8B7C6X5_PHODC|nr:rab3 GTPase-activating protein non-catalytic subunit-like isoform X4 [Phoenix dactylifera]
MARRSHLTHVGCIACDEMEELGAGEREGWLDDPGLLAALHPHALALAHSARSLVLVLGWDRDPDPSSPRQPLKIRPSLAADEGHISAIEWLPFGDLLALALATSAGHLFVYSLTGDLIHKQIIHSGRVLRLRFRETKVGSSQDSVASMELCVVLPGVIARFDGSDIQSLLQRWFQEERSRIFENRFQNRNTVDENSYGRIPFQLWNVSKFGSCADAAITGLMPPPLLELQLLLLLGSQVSAITVQLRLERMLRYQHTASPLTCLKDPPRKGEKLTLSPGGTLAAITDSLGRILLLDTQALVVVRLWKGYRDACCLFIEMLVNRDKASSSAYYEHTKGDYCLCLAIHAPRKGIIEGPSLEFVGDYWDQLGFSVVHFLSSSIKSSYLVTIIKTLLQSGACGGSFTCCLNLNYQNKRQAFLQASLPGFTLDVAHTIVIHLHDLEDANWPTCPYHPVS